MVSFPFIDLRTRFQCDIVLFVEIHKPIFGWFVHGTRKGVVYVLEIQEVIVVEGRDDRNAILRAVKADILETGGSAVDAKVIDRVRLAQQRRGVIIFTDPDHAGERIRTKISQAVPGCKHAFLRPEEAFYKGKYGVEYANPETIRIALEAVRDPYKEINHEELITWEELIDAGFVAGSQSASYREQVGSYLRIGYANAQQFYKRCQSLRITRTEFQQALRHLQINTRESEVL